MILPALLLGLTGSWHCVLMCGPLDMLVTSKSSGFGLIARKLTYHSGRLLTYILLGMTIGLAGFGLKLTGFQHYFALIIGVMLMVLAMFNGIRKFEKVVSKPVTALINKYKALILRKYNTQSLPGIFMLGMFNGFLPCGLVYVALATALVQPDITDSIIFMLIFGLGTWPALLFISIFPIVRSGLLRLLSSGRAAIFVFIIGLLVVARSFYVISPNFQEIVKKGGDAAITICGG
ncbi:sulfite exporter TauE/SafE family protein [Marinigracilibium pacificum]|uniref:Sulfite exporter TauE/SafE family protein n=1 Tax=Marinigracilibium pacificum TaxID=2729599 RepID=A0A848JB36_9BACT|nr:sulfite exporter TauE/SafE family protein [Marinigracilibium pacificum]NMM50242.1 sulfite exporter TauE/SafE family protein [Marinigracilibium pacificum]